MIFVAVGTQLPFDRLIRGVDEWAGAGAGREVVAQIAGGEYEPRYLQWQRNIAPQNFREYIAESRLVVAHAGIGTILSALELGKPVVVLPRRADLGEHRNDHQLATADRFGARQLVSVAHDVEELQSLLDAYHAPAAGNRISTAASPELLGRLSAFIQQTANNRNKVQSCR